MKRIFTILVLLLAIAAQAQNSNVNKAESAIKEGNLVEAKELITPALENDKTFDKGRTWFINGNLYKAILLSDDPEVQALDGDALNKALESYRKTMELEKPGSPFYEFSTFALDELWGAMVNKGAQEFDNDDLDKALDYFLKSKLVRPGDTTSILYTGVAAASVGNYDLALENYRELMDKGIYREDVYGSMFQIQRGELNDNEAALATLQEAISHFPENDNFKSLEIEMLIAMDKIGEATTKLEDKIAQDPSDPVLHFSLGYMYDESNQKDKAKASYEKAVELDPKYYEANVNLAIIYYNQAIELYKEYNNLSMADYKTKGPAMEKKAQDLMKQSLPYWEAAHNSRPEQRTAIENLQTVYARLKMYEKSEEMRKKLEALDNNN